MDVITGNRKLRVLLYISSLHYGGAEMIVADLFRLLDRREFDVTLCLSKFRGAIGDRLINEGYRIVELPVPTGRVRKYLFFKQLRDFIKCHGFDVVHSHCASSFFDSAIAKMCGGDFRMIHTFHFGNYPNYKMRYKVFEGMFSRVADVLVAVGQSQARTIEKMYWLDRYRMTTIWNGVADPVLTEDSSWSSQWRQYPGQILIGSIGNLIPQKGYEELIEVAHIFKECGRSVKFIVVGGGYLEVELKKRCRQRGLDDCITFVGFLDQAASRALPAFDIFFMPSRWEAMSVALLEAMAAQKAVVATSVGDNAVVIKDQESGLIVPPYNPVAMADALARLIDQPELRMRMAKSARLRYEKKFSVHYMVNRYELLYKESLVGACTGRSSYFIDTPQVGE